MRTVTEAKTAEIGQLLDHAHRLAQEAAATETYRAEAMKAIRERLMAQYHAGRAETLRTLADQFRTAASDIKDAPLRTPENRHRRHA